MLCLFAFFTFSTVFSTLVDKFSICKIFLDSTMSKIKNYVKK